MTSAYNNSYLDSFAVNLEDLEELEALENQWYIVVGNSFGVVVAEANP